MIGIFCFVGSIEAMIAGFLSKTPLDEIVVKCQEESGRRNVPQPHCFELFRLAIDERRGEAWEAVHTQYVSLVCHWILKSRPGQFSHEEVDELAADTLSKFWSTLVSRSISVAKKFPHIGAILRYLNQCALSAVYDTDRYQTQQQNLQDRIIEGKSKLSAYVMEEHLVERMEDERRTQQLQRWLDSHVTDELEQKLINLLYVQGLTPREIAKQHADSFADARAVYRVRERILKRARRSLALAESH